MKSYRIVHKAEGDNGIMRWISRKTKIDDISGKGLIKLSVDNTRSISGPPSQLIGYNPTNYGWWATDDFVGTHYYMIDFLSFDVFVDGYSTTCSANDVMRDLYVYGSIDFDNWVLMDQRSFNENPSTGKLFNNCLNPMKARYVAFVTNSTNFQKQNSFALNSLDLYGTIKWFVQCSYSMKKSYHLQNILL